MLEEKLRKLNQVIDLGHVAAAEKLMLSAASCEPVERLPLVVNYPITGWECYTYKETFYDMEKMLNNQLAQVWNSVQIRDDRVYTIRANYGVGIIASMFGCEIYVDDDNNMPWAFHISDEQLDRILEKGFVDIEAGLGARVLETERYYIDVLSRYDKLAEAVHVYVCDTQGPFDNAHLIMGHKIYTEIYDNPERVHRLLEIISDTYIKFTKVQKEIIGESGNVHCHMDIKAPGAVRVCDDASINISADSYREFSKPYNERVLSECGGGWIHYCGNGKQIFPEVISSKNLKGINFGNPELQDINEIYKEASDRNVAVLSWLGDVPDNAKTGITLLRNSNSLESACQLVANHVAQS